MSTTGIECGAQSGYDALPRCGTYRNGVVWQNNDGNAAMNRNEQIDFMESAEERAQGYLRRWLSNPEYRAVLHRYDHECRNGGKAKEKVACACC